MLVGVEFALSERKRASAMLRGHEWATARRHPLNRGIIEDLDACVAAGLLRPEASAAGLVYWLGVCQLAMINILEERLARPAAAQRLEEILILALNGLGVTPSRATDLAAWTAARLVQNGASGP